MDRSLSCGSIRSNTAMVHRGPFGDEDSRHNFRQVRPEFSPQATRQARVSCWTAVVVHYAFGAPEDQLTVVTMNHEMTDSEAFSTCGKSIQVRTSSPRFPAKCQPRKGVSSLSHSSLYGDVILGMVRGSTRTLLMSLLTSSGWPRLTPE